MYPSQTSPPPPRNSVSFQVTPRLVLPCPPPSPPALFCGTTLSGHYPGSPSPLKTSPMFLVSVYIDFSSTCPGEGLELFSIGVGEFSPPLSLFLSFKRPVETPAAFVFPVRKLSPRRHFSPRIFFSGYPRRSASDCLLTRLLWWLLPILSFLTLLRHHFVFSRVVRLILFFISACSGR